MSTATGERWARWLPVSPATVPPLAVFGLFLTTILGGVAVVQVTPASALRAYGDPSSAANVLHVGAAVAVGTGLMLAFRRLGAGYVILRLLFLGALCVGTFETAVAASVPPLVAGVATVGLAGALFAYPEWYVLDVAGVVFGAVVVATLGYSLGPLPAVLALVGLAGYDAVAVYHSEHMQSVAEGASDLRLPMLFVVPADPSFSLLDDWHPIHGTTDEDRDDATDADTNTSENANTSADGDDGVNDDTPRARVLGVGDAVFPGLLVVSAAQFLDAPVVVAGLNLPSLGALVGAVVGFLGVELLLRRVERAHAGLPPLNGGVLVGYLLGAIAAGVPLAAAVGL